eukprot:Skav235983  [mRNA]  locus=scaffold592:368301:371149:- [translate_table: standard]
MARKYDVIAVLVHRSTVSADAEQHTAAPELVWPLLSVGLHCLFDGNAATDPHECGVKATLRGIASSAGSNLRILRVLRLARLTRIFRVLRVVRFVQPLQTLVVAIFETLRALLWALMLLLLINYMRLVSKL